MSPGPDRPEKHRENSGTALALGIASAYFSIQKHPPDDAQERTQNNRDRTSTAGRQVPTTAFELSKTTQRGEYCYFVDMCTSYLHHSQRCRMRSVFENETARQRERPLDGRSYQEQQRGLPSNANQSLSFRRRKRKTTLSRRPRGGAFFDGTWRLAPLPSNISLGTAIDNAQRAIATTWCAPPTRMACWAP
jgi:hypothetical protein